MSTIGIVIGSAVPLAPVVVAAVAVVVVVALLLVRALRARSRVDTARLDRSAVPGGASSTRREPPESADQVADPTWELTPTGSDLAELVDAFIDLGMRVEWSTRGDVEALPTAVGVALYQTVRDVLSAARARGEQRVKLSLVRTGTVLAVTALCDLPGANSADVLAAHLAQLAARVAPLGGSVQTEVIHGGGPDAQVRIDVTVPTSERA